MNTDLTATEAEIALEGWNVSEDELADMREIFQSVPVPAYSLSESDKEELRAVLPQLDLNAVQDCLVKPLRGPCNCGRTINLLDIILSAVRSGKHGSRFLTEILQGTRGRFVIVGYQSRSGVPEHLKDRLPAKTIYVRDVAPIPCKDCGTEQDAMLLQGNVCHFWIQ